ncbi:MAG: hypothetical protein PUK59_08300 [Actinomycetaceae bacterium]|nr:hypothetical protein [Actinomycetaceae bacterium]MDY5854746.1 hypothetical protein [Arcanobacterium sp.]
MDKNLPQSVDRCSICDGRLYGLVDMEVESSCITTRTLNYVRVAIHGSAVALHKP